MAVIKSGVSTDQWTIDPVSKAGRVTLYDSSGKLVVKEYDASYMVRIEVIPTTLTAGTTYFAMRNVGGKRVFIRKIEMKLGFSGTATASRSLYEWERFSAATPTGGTALTALKKGSTFPNSSVGDIRFAPGGLTITGVVFEAPFHLVGNTNQLNNDQTQDISYVDGPDIGRLVLAVGEGLCVRANTAIVAGSYLIGSITWDELT